MDATPPNPPDPPDPRALANASPEAMIFGENLDEFAARVANICALEQGGHLNQIDAYRQIKALYKQLRSSKRNLLDPEEPTG